MAGRLGVCGGLLAIFLLLTGFLSRPSEAQDKQTDAPAVGLPTLPEAPRAERADPRPLTPPAAPPVQAAPGLKSIEQLIAALTDLRAKKADLDRQEKETIAALKQRFHEQRLVLAEQARKLRELGIEVFETPPVAAPAAEPTAPIAPSPRLVPSPVPDGPKEPR
jgi:hypothetical protein